MFSAKNFFTKFLVYAIVSNSDFNPNTKIKYNIINKWAFFFDLASLVEIINSLGELIFLAILLTIEGGNLRTT